MQWKSDSYLSACLLVLMVRSTSTLFVVIYQIAVPYMMFLLEKCGTKDDKKCFNRMRVGFSWFNKILLLYYGWSVSYWALLTVCVVIFTEISKLGFGLIFFSVAWMMKNGRQGISRLVSIVDPHKTFEHKAIQYKLMLCVISFACTGVALLYTWPNIGYSVICLRGVLLLLNLCLFPEYCVMVMGVVAVGISKVFRAVQFAVDNSRSVIHAIKKGFVKEVKEGEDEGDNYGFTPDEWAQMEAQMKIDEEKEREEAMKDID